MPIKKITPKLRTKAKEYALSGFTHRQIAKSIGVAPTTLYADMDIMNTIREAEDELRLEVAKSIRSSVADGQVAVQIFLSKRLNLYSSSYSIPQIRTVKSALSQISKINADLAKGTIPTELANNLIKNIEVFIKAYEVSELEARVIKLEEGEQ